MKKYIKPDCEIIEMNIENGLLAASDPKSYDETGDGKWNAPQRPRLYYDEEEE